MIRTLKPVVQRRWRARRMAAFCQRLWPQPGQRIIDLGGTADLWQYVATPLRILLVNLPGGQGDIPAQTHHQFECLDHDLGLPLPFADRAFDIAFSNSVIEHLPVTAHAVLTVELQRLASRYWLQTPARQFPIECHCHLPFWWWYPAVIQQRWINHWQRTNPFLATQMQTTTALCPAMLNTRLPDACRYDERIVGLTKSHAFYRTG